MAAPRQRVHVEPRCIGEMDEEDTVAGDRLQRLEFKLAREGMEAVDDESHGRMIGAADDFPSVAIVVDVAAPGERLKADAQAAPGCALAEFAEVGGGAVYAAERVGRDVAAYEQEVAADLLHHVELAFGAVEGARALRLRCALEIAEWLERAHLEAEVGDLLRYIRRRPGVRQQIALADLDPTETGLGDCFQLLVPTAREANRGNGGFHGPDPP